MRSRLGPVAVSIVLLTQACRLRYEELAFDIDNDASGATVSVGGGGSDPVDAGGATSDGGALSSPAGGGSGAIQGGDSSTIAGAPAGGVEADCAASEELIGNGSPSAAPALNCAAPGALVCDDFEGGQLPYWSVWLGPPAFGSLQGCVVHGGSRALFVQANTPNQAQIVQPLPTPTGSGSLFLRTFVYLPSGQTLPDWTVLYEVWDSPTSATDKISLDLHADGSLDANDSVAGGGTISTGAITLPRDKWTCLELEVVVDKTNGAVRIHMDDTQVAASASPMRTRGNQAFTTVLQGAVVAAGSLSIYYDDFVAATQRVGCQ
jgi:hypothetical protein